MSNSISQPVRHLFDGQFTDHQDPSFNHSFENFLLDQHIYAPIDQKKTKIVATIGPVTESEAQITALILAGMNVARLNTKHNDAAWHKAVAQRIRKVSAQLAVPVGILLDLQGPEIRINLVGQSFVVAKGEATYFTANTDLPNEKKALVPETVVENLNVGNHIILEDGACEFVIVEKNPHFLRAEALEVCS